MAEVETQPIRLSYTIRDELGTEAATVLHADVDPAQTLSAAATEWQDFGILLNAVCGGNITRGRLELILAPPAPFTGKPVAGSRVEQTGLFNFSTGSTPFRTAAVVPAFLSTKLSGGKINNADTDVAAFINAVVAVPALLNGQFTDLTLANLVAFVDSILSFRKRRKQLQRSSFNITP